MKKFNWIDAVIILLVVAIGIFGVWFLKGRQAQQMASTSNVKIYVTVEMKEITEDVVKAYKVGEKVTLGTTNVDEGVVTDVEYVPYTEDLEDYQNGKFKIVEFEGLYTANITMAVDGTETDTLIRSANEEYRIGEQLVFHGKGFAGDGYVVGLTTEKEGK